MTIKNINLNPVSLLILFFTITFVLITTPFYDLEATLIFGGKDGIDYFKISESAPQIASNIQYIKSERFLFPYFIGLFSNYFNFDIFNIYRICSVIFCLFFVYLITILLENLKCPAKLKLLFLLIIILNPYLIRYYIALPTLINDIIFLNIVTLLAISLLKKNYYLFYSAIFFGFFCRQNTFAFILSLYLIFFLERFFLRKKKLFDLKNVIISTSVVILVSYINYSYAKHTNSIMSGVDLYSVAIFGIFNTNYSIISFIKFIIFPLLSFFPLLILIIFEKFEHSKLNSSLKLFFIFSVLFLIAQPFLAGPVVAGKNFIRLSNYSFPLIIFLLSSIISSKAFFEQRKNNAIYIIFILILYFWSMHPTFSKIKFFENLSFNII